MVYLLQQHRKEIIPHFSDKVNTVLNNTEQGEMKMFYSDLESYLLYGDKISHTDDSVKSYGTYSFEPIDMEAYLFGGSNTTPVSYDYASYTDTPVSYDVCAYTDYDTYTSDKYDTIIASDYCELSWDADGPSLSEYETGYSDDCFFYNECLTDFGDYSSYGDYETGTDYDISDM